jgi:hypothetical protein
MAYDISVPRGLPVTVTDATGNLTVSGFSGQVTLSDGSGDITLTFTEVRGGWTSPMARATSP